MNYSTRELMKAVYEGKEPHRVVWHPRIKHWYDVGIVAGTLPEKYQGMFLDEIYEDLAATPRRVWGLYDPLVPGYISLEKEEGTHVDVSVTSTKKVLATETPGDYLITRYTTPKGEIKQIQKMTEHNTTKYNIEYFIKNLRDIEVYKYILQERSYHFNWLRYRWGEKRFGEIYIEIARVSLAPLMNLITTVMGLKTTVLMLWKHSKEVEELMRIMEKDVEKQIDVFKGTPVVDLNFGDNMHQDLCSPPMFKKYGLPFYNRIVHKIHDIGKFATSHWDGFVTKLLPLANETGLDGLECLTHLPQGDIKLEETKKYVIDKGMFVRDGIPAVLFTKYHSIKELETFTWKILDLLGRSGRLILGISDQLPANGDIERVRFVGEIVEEWNNSYFG